MPTFLGDRLAGDRRLRPDSVSVIKIFVYPHTGLLRGASGEMSDEGFCGEKG
jgi:hypothetical protein